MAKKLLSVLLALVMLLSITACGNSDSGGNSNESSANTSSAIDPETVNLGKYEEPVTLSTFFRISTTILDQFDENELEDMYIYQQLHEQTNIYLDYEWYAAATADDAVQKTSMAIASGDIPDFMIVDRAQLAMLAQTDLIVKDLQPLWDAYASDKLKEWTTAEGDAAWESMRYNDGIIGIPVADGIANKGEMLWIRQDWLENLNLEIPTTMDELYQVMLAFKNDDPDGNGQDDTIGMTLHNDFLNGPGMGDAVGVFNGFGAYPLIWVEDGSGNLTYGSTMEGAKDALQWLNNAYNDGLILQDFSAMDSTKASEATVSGRSGVQYGANWNANAPLQNAVNNNPDARWIAVPMPDADGTVTPQSDLNIRQMYVISSKCEHPEAVIKLLNFYVDVFTSDEEEREKYYVEDGSGNMSFPLHYVSGFMSSNAMTNLNAYWNVCDALESGDTSALTGEEMGYYNSCVAYLDGDTSQWGGYMTFGPENSGYSVICDDYYANSDNYVIDAFYGADTPTMQTKLSAVEDKIMEYYTQVIMGVKTLDDWDSFMTEVNNLGLEQITQEVNEWYQEQGGSAPGAKAAE